MPSKRQDSITDSLFNWFGYGGSATEQKQEKQAMRALPANWYQSDEMYQLERRSIFSRKWQLITHKCRLPKPGDWLKFEIANFSFVITHDRAGNFNAFHNVCRHRAFPVVTEGSGSSRIFSCKYHGWSYGLNGKLAKAPGYQELEGFDKEKNSLMPIHLHVDRNGFMYVNLDAKETPEIAWEDDLIGMDTQERYNDFNFEDYQFDHFWEMEGNYNWKILADNYNECYHCATSHPDIGAVANLQSYSVDTARGQIVHNPATTQEQRDAGLVVASTYYFPNVSTNITPHFFMIQRFVPSSSSKSSMQYQVFRNKHSTDEQFDLVSQIYKRVMSEDKYLCNLAQQNINAGVFTNGELHPRLEKGPLYFQSNVRDTVMEHFEKEKRARKEIWPARPELPSTGNAKVSKADIEFCSGLSCASPPKALDW
ncbi:Carnitine monooxygenase oxygenase subunit [Fulvia fulva]|uniref:Choline monooxygenase, chloroplastic n=1 Tax=Passalora fulva TaxID=5499 RepID=A0A9Q8UVS2_PASFU|nr:Carnitine monooxygenase oxygenase subunit [Fulvia fulva]KAK4610315.1 Carnitine monooxygenase oxygenase subunit [Fulvia fulva]KAK4611302.1 Carnitine monooxygenase oxygenase subunit [Fulvia fulva]UJO24263.1 Carnitine monooxygenase oxygenase subunit [Fulvia fulva]WPV22148.1 Carnitine monooxygenase oxygenase subunit [Fulvia fulva]WPV37009.1 Carnitine monooxygenase oxygenase subunit [Fulvia fulva]